MKNCLIQTYFGHGDCIWQLPFIETLSEKYDEVYIQTYFPFLFSHLKNAKFVKSQTTKLSTCASSLNKYESIYVSDVPKEIETIKFPYYLQTFKRGQNLVESFSSVVSVTNEKLNAKMHHSKEVLKEAQKIYDSIKIDNRQVCIIKPPVDRKDWSCTARLPRIEYYQYIIDNYKDNFIFVTIGDKDNEIHDKTLENVDFRFENAELSLPTINALVSLVDLVITHNCFLFPVGLKNHTKTLVINGGFSDPHYYIDIYRTDLSNLRVVHPIPLCTCLDKKHNCHKEISLDKIKYAIESLCDIKPTEKKNILLCRIRSQRVEAFYNNKILQKHFNIYTVDHMLIADYKRLNFINESYQFSKIKDDAEDNELKHIKQSCKDIITKHNIDIVVNAQPLHPYNRAMKSACEELNVDMINYETFFDDKWVLDRKGGQYTASNEIFDYVDKIKIPENYKIDYPSSSRERQPNLISRRDLFQKYDLDLNNNHIVVFGQLLWDMSLKENLSSTISYVTEFYKTIFESNSETKFLFKIHPKYPENHEDMRFLQEHENVIVVTESLETLFNNFECFVSYSSHCIFEALLRKKNIATCGFHYCTNDKLTYQLTTKKDCKDLYNKIYNFKIDLDLLDRYMYFICNYYTVDVSSLKMYQRLTQSSDEYFLNKTKEENDKSNTASENV